MFVVVEPGSPKGFRYIYSLRETFIKKPREEACIVAPCPHHLTCPKASIAKTWCHFSQFVPKFPPGLVPRAARERTIDNEKFSYLILKKGKRSRMLTLGDREDAERDIRRRGEGQDDLGALLLLAPADSSSHKEERTRDHGPLRQRGHH